MTVNWQHFFDSRDMGFWSVETFLTVKTSVVWTVETFLTVKTFLTVETWVFDLSWPKVSIETIWRQTDTLGIIQVKMSVFKLLKLFWQSRCQFLNCQVFFDSWDMGFWSVETFLTVKLSEFWSVNTFLTVETWVFDMLRLFWQSRHQFLNCQCFFDIWDISFLTVIPKSIDRDHVETNQDLRALFMSKCQFLICWDFFDSLNVNFLKCLDFFDGGQMLFFELLQLFWQLWHGFLICQNFFHSQDIRILNCWHIFDNGDMGFWSVITKSHQWDHVETNQYPRA